MIRTAVMALAIMIGLSGCATTPYAPFNQANVKNIQTVNTRSVIVQDEVVAKADPSNISAAAGGGLIPALIDASVTRSRQESLNIAMEGFYDSLGEYDFRAAYWPELTKQVEGNFPLKVSGLLKTARTLSPKELEQILSKLGKDEGYLQLRTEYFLSTDLRTLNVMTTAHLWSKDDTRPFYVNTVIYQSAVMGTGGASSLAIWSQNSARPFIEKLKEGTQETLAMLAIDLGHSGSGGSNVQAAQQISAPYNFGAGAAASQKSQQGTLVARRGERVVLRDAAGRLYSLLP